MEILQQSLNYRGIAKTEIKKKITELKKTIYIYIYRKINKGNQCQI